MANLYTRGGDKGQTSLVGGSRVSKSDPKVECYGTIDEANSMLGLAYAQTDNEFIRATVRKIQGRLFSVGAELASDSAETAAALQGNITEEDVAFLEGVVDTCTQTTGRQTHFVIPGVDPASAALHVARTIVRRAERRAVELPVREVLVRYINRLSDAIYAMARLQEDLTQMREKVTDLVKEAMERQAVTTQAPAGLPPMSLEVLHRMAARAEEKSKELGVPVVFSAVDAGGNLMLLQRMEGALVGSIEVSQGKAYTAYAFQMPTHELGAASRPDGPLYGIESSNPGKIVLFGGGFPYVVDGRVAGGIGVSGGTVEQDMEIARYAMLI